VKDEKDPHLIAGAAGVGAALGTDFAKINYPQKAGIESKDILKEAVSAAGRTKVVWSGGKNDDVNAFLHRLHDQIHISGACGSATGRNIHQKSLDDAIRMCTAIYAISIENATVEDALKIFRKLK